MRHRFIILTLATVAAFGSLGSARAENADDMSFAGLFKADRIDKNKDGMVSKAEFLAMMAKTYDMKAKEMKARRSGMDGEQMKAFTTWLSRGEKN